MQRAWAFAGVVLGSTLSGCGGTEAEARAKIEERGITPTEVTKTDEGFSFKGTKGDDVCSGMVTIEKGFGKSSHTISSTCQAMGSGVNGSRRPN